MFKLIKIINSGVNVPEPMRLPKASATVIKAGCMLTLSAGALANCTATATPQYVALADAPAGTTEALCAAISSSMLFEAPVSVAPTSLTVGSKVTLAIDSDSSAYGVTATTSSGVATVIDLCGAAAANDRITVKF